VNRSILKEIQCAQERRRKQFGPNEGIVDSRHEKVDWELSIGEKHLMLHDCTPTEWRQKLIEIASLCLSAIESFDRKNK
jgi:hypothetical protein